MKCEISCELIYILDPAHPHCSLSKQTHHIHDLLESETKPQLDCIRLIDHRSLQLLIVWHEVIDQSPLCWTSFTTWENIPVNIWFRYVICDSRNYSIVWCKCIYSMHHPLVWKANLLWKIELMGHCIHPMNVLQNNNLTRDTRDKSSKFDVFFMTCKILEVCIK